MTEVIVRVHSVHLVYSSSKRPPTLRPSHLTWVVTCESACRLLSSTTTIAIYYYYSARMLILIYRPTEGRKLS